MLNSVNAISKNLHSNPLLITQPLVFKGKNTLKKKLSTNEKKIKKCFLSQKKVVTCAKIEQLENFI
jgi:hypothetical protein